MTQIEYISGTTFHSRKGQINNEFKFKVDYLLIDCGVEYTKPFLFSHNKKNVMSFYDKDHGGSVSGGKGSKWATELLYSHGFLNDVKNIYLLTQVRVFGHVFNPVSFWLCYDKSNNLIVAIAEVSNTFSERHAYICAHSDARPIRSQDKILAAKVFHVSPFQSVAGEYQFQFNFTGKKVNIVIDYTSGIDGVYANLQGERKPLTNLSILKIALRRPLGGWRVLFLIHYQAIKLWFKGAVYHKKPLPPQNDVSR